MIVSDNGSEFTSNAILAWADQVHVEWTTSAPGRPMQNTFIDSFKDRMRDEPLNETLFTSLAQTRASLAPVARRLQPRGLIRRSKGQTPTSLHRPSTRDGHSRCAMRKAPRQCPSLPPRIRANPTPETNSKLDTKNQSRRIATGIKISALKNKTPKSQASATR